MDAACKSLLFGWELPVTPTPRAQPPRSPFPTHPRPPSQTYGLKVIRLWAFNHNMPFEWGKYAEDEFRGLDYIIDSAGAMTHLARVRLVVVRRRPAACKDLHSARCEPPAAATA